MKNFISKRASFIKASLPLFSKKLFVFFALFLFSTPNFSQAHFTHPGVIYPGTLCFNPSSVCQTVSGNICPLVRHYTPQSFSACLTSGLFYLCYQSPQIFYPNPVCISKGSPCFCASPQINYWNGISYYIYEQGISF